MEPSQLIDQQIADLGDWRGELYARLRALVNAADPSLREDWKWGTAVWVNQGTVCAVSAFKNHVKMNFFKGASLPDPHGLFNSGLDAKTMRSIDFHPGDPVDETGLTELVRAATAANLSKKR
jgi:hypothetical protein